MSMSGTPPFLPILGAQGYPGSEIFSFFVSPTQADLPPSDLSSAIPTAKRRDFSQCVSCHHKCVRTLPIPRRIQSLQVTWGGLSAQSQSLQRYKVKEKERKVYSPTVYMIPHSRVPFINLSLFSTTVVFSEYLRIR